MQLKIYAELLLSSRLVGDANVEITGLQTDSNKVKPGDLFFCITGLKNDGHDHAPMAAEKGAAALVVQRELEGVALPQLIVRNTRHALAALAAFQYGYASKRLRMIGITGTNGKTTTTYLIDRILADYGASVGVIGTIKMKYGGNDYPMSGTTPGALDLQRYLHDMAEAGTEYCVMEVSSHALEQGRVLGCDFRTAIFTNLTQDHLDYHLTMENYRAAKGLFFSRLGNSYAADPAERKYAVLNADDPASAEFARLTAAETILYGIDHEADVRATGMVMTGRGTKFHVETFRGETDIQLQMVGKFNVYNALAAISAALAEGIPLEHIKRSLESVKGVEGRVEAVDAGQSFAVIVDYAHTPDGLENVLLAVKEFAEGRVLCVFGCGGDRDRTKRPIMGRIAAKYADQIIVTSDNPRSEKPEDILRDIEQALIEDRIDPERYVIIADRRAAIQKAIDMASSKDVVLIAGKGHETGQIIGSQTFDFDDRIVAAESIRSRTSD